MAIVRAKNPLRWVRRALLALGVLGVVAVGLLLTAYRFGSAGGSEERERRDRTAPPTDEQTVAASQGFDYTQFSEGRKVFRIRAERSRQDRADTAFMEEVLLDVYRDDGDVYTVASDRARVNQQTWAAELEGDVVVTGWEDFELRARALRLENQEVLTSVGAVEFRYPPDLVGRASSLRLDRGGDLFQLSDGVHIKSVPGAEIPVRLDCERLIYQRREGLIRALNDVYLRHGDQELAAHALTVFLDDEPRTGSEAGSRTLRNLRARWEVRGTLISTDGAGGSLAAGSPEASRVDFSGELLELEPSPEDSSVRKVRLEGGGGKPASVKLVDASGLARRLTGRVVESRSRAGQLHIVRISGGPLVFDEFLDFEPPFYLRQACARRASVRFLPDGRIGQIQLEREVELRNEDLQLSGGARADLNLEAGRLEIQGPEVELYSDRGSITAPRFVYSRERGLVRALSGVRATLRQTAAFQETLLSAGEGPIRVEAEEAVWTTEPPTFSFRGGVRAWRGQSLLLADQLRGSETLEEMAASGNVKSVWVPRSGVPADDAQPIEVRADGLSFSGGAPDAGAGAGVRTLVYDGRVEVRQEGRTIACRELSVEFGPAPAGEEAERMICRGQVKISDPVANRLVLGDTAIYTVAEARVEVFGDNVRLRDAAGNSLAGRYLVYDLEAGNVQIQSRMPRSAAAPADRPGAGSR